MVLEQFRGEDPIFSAIMIFSNVVVAEKLFELLLRDNGLTSMERDLHSDMDKTRPEVDEKKKNESI